MLTNVVVSGVPFQRMRAPETKREPLAVSVNAGDPTRIAGGLSEWRVGRGFVMASESMLD